MTLTREQAREIWMEGFSESGEGWNGEYPLNHWRQATRDAAAAQLETRFDEYWAKYQKQQGVLTQGYND